MVCFFLFELFQSKSTEMATTIIFYIIYHPILACLHQAHRIAMPHTVPPPFLTPALHLDPSHIHSSSWVEVDLPISDLSDRMGSVLLSVKKLLTTLLFSTMFVVKHCLAESNVALPLYIASSTSLFPHPFFTCRTAWLVVLVLETVSTTLP